MLHVMLGQSQPPLHCIGIAAAADIAHIARRQSRSVLQPPPSIPAGTPISNIDIWLSLRSCNALTAHTQRELMRGARRAALERTAATA